MSAAPMRESQPALEARRGRESVSGPSQQRIALRKHPIRRSIQVKHRKGCSGRLCRDQCCDGRCSRNTLVEKGNAEKGSRGRIQDGKGRLSLEER